jgi:hypothetical protein
MHSTSVSFSAPSNGAGYFCFGKSSQNHCAEHAGCGDILSPQLPCASRAKRAGANSAVHGLKHARLAPACRCDARRHARRDVRFDGGHPWPATSLPYHFNVFK